MPEVGQKVAFKRIDHTDAYGEGIVDEVYGDSALVTITEYTVPTMVGTHIRLLDREILEVVDCGCDEPAVEEPTEDDPDA